MNAQRLLLTRRRRQTKQWTQSANFISLYTDEYQYLSLKCVARSTKQVTVKNKIKDAPIENQCTTSWLFIGFLPHEMFNLLFWSSKISIQHLSLKQAEMLNWYSSQYKLTKVWLLILVKKTDILEKKWYPAFSTRPRVFHQTPRFPHPVPRDPGTPGPRPRVFHLANANAVPRFPLMFFHFHSTSPFTCN